MSFRPEHRLGFKVAGIEGGLAFFAKIKCENVDPLPNRPPALSGRRQHAFLKYLIEYIFVCRVIAL
tara:strand:- start:1582 stop:1779 length:198 start_codon:yes stop_codon:yes gene_type:complete